MQQAELERRLKQILMDRVGVPEEKVKPEASLVDDLGFDSLDGVELAMSIEDEFGIELDDDQAKQFITVADALNYVQNLLLQKQTT